MRTLPDYYPINDSRQRLEWAATRYLLRLLRRSLFVRRFLFGNYSSKPDGLVSAALPSNGRYPASECVVHSRECPMLPAAILVIAHQKFPTWAVFGIVFGLLGFARGFRLLQRKRLILNTPASKIRSAAMGLVEISGLATGPHIIVSALKQIDCYYYRSIAWELKQRGKNSEWVKVAEESLHVPFYVDDSTDKLLIDPTGAEMDLHCDFHEECHESLFFGGDVPSTISGFLERHGVTPRGKIKVEEYCIKPENFLFVLGTLSQNPGVDATVAPPWAARAGQAQKMPVKSNGDGEALQQIIRLSAGAAPVPVAQMTQQQKIAAALAKSGSLTSLPWTSLDEKVSAPAAGVPEIKPSSGMVATEEKRVAADATGFDLHPPVFLMKGANEPTFFISWRSQRDVVNSLNWKSALMIWGCPALVLVGVWGLIEYFGLL